MATMHATTMVGGHARPAWAGPVIIQDNQPGMMPISAANPRAVHGIIVPVSTKGRPSAPSPLSGFGTGKAMGTDKGHMMALELGGPDISENISPQSSRWQQSGGWRAIETNALHVAMQWMGIWSTYDPASGIPAPSVAGYFRVGPSDETDPTNGEPAYYIGSITRVVIVGPPRIYTVPAERYRQTIVFQIEPGQVWWDGRKVLEDTVMY